MKKIIASIQTAIILGSLVMFTPVFAFADTASSTVTASAQVQSLLTQIQNLQAQLQALHTAQTQVQIAATNVSSTLSLIRSLRQGMSGADVATLQAILAADPNVFPEGSITGFFGRLTAEAVKKFQRKHGIDPLGLVGPKTLKKLNEEIHSLGLSEESNATTTPSGKHDDRDEGKNEGKKLCIPPGHMIAPGWLKHNERPIPTQLIPLCNNKENNGDDHNNGNASTTPTLTTNASASVIIGGMIHDTAHVNFGNNPTGTISFNVYAPYDSACTMPLFPSPTATTVNGNGNYDSGNFTATTTGIYRFVATYSGDSKNVSVHTNCNDANESVTITAAPDTTAPVISAISATPLATTSTVTWTTNEVGTSNLWFGTTNPLVLGSSTLVSSGTLVTAHTVLLAPLATSTTYFYVVVSADGSGNTATSSQGSFTTLSM